MTKKLPLSLVFLFLFAACLQGARAPSVAAQRTLSLDVELGDARPKSEFGIIFAGPKGPTQETGEVTIVFNRPMRPLELAGDESAPPATIRRSDGAAPKGSWKWLGTSALMFAADPPLPRATEYTVDVPAGVKALDGSPLAKPYSFSFSTSRPRVARIEPRDGAAHLTPTQTFTVFFNQPVDPKEVERAGKVLVGAKGDAKPVGFTARWPDRNVTTKVEIKPTAPLPLASVVSVAFEGLKGMEGALPLEGRYAATMETYGPLVVSNADCSRGGPNHKCTAGGGLYVSLSNRVSLKDLRAHVRVDGVALDWGSRVVAPDEKTSWLSVPARLKAARTYRLVVTAGLKDEYGQTLAKDHVYNAVIDDEWPRVGIGLEGSVFEATRGRTLKIPVGAINVPRYELLTAAIDEETVARAMSEGVDGQWDEGQKKGRVDDVRAAAPKNTADMRYVDLAQTLAPKKGRGAVLFGVRRDASTRGRATEVRLVNVTDLAIAAKWSRFGSMVWVTRLGDGKPAAGATVTIRDKSGAERFSGKVDADGALAIPGDRFQPIRSWDDGGDDGAVVFARVGDDFTFRAVRDTLQTWRYEAHVDPDGKLGVHGLLFTDRGIYKPGEHVLVKGIFRQELARGTSTPVGRKVTLTATDGSGSEIFNQEAALGPYGEMSADVTIPTSAHLGQLDLRARVDAAPDAKSKYDGAGGVAHASVDVAAYRPAEFKVAVEPSKPAYVRGDKADFAVRGDYLFGAPMTQDPVRYTVTRGPGYFVPPAHEGFVVSDDEFASGSPEQSLRGGGLQGGRGALDGKGTFPGAVALSLPGQRGPETVSIEAEVEDVSRQTIAGRTSFVVHPGEFYVAMKPPAELFVEKGKPLRPDVVAVEPSGKRRAGVRVALELVRRSWHTVVESADEYGGHYVSKAVDTKVATCELVTSDKPATCDVPVVESGYFILRASAKDGRGNTVAASTGLYATGSSEVVAWAESDVSRVDLVTDKKAYEIGDTAKILVKNPFREAEALVTVERAGVYRKQRVALSGAMPVVSIPVTDDLAPNAFVSIHLVKGRTQAAPAKGVDVGAPAFRSGYATLAVNPEARRLKVAITPARRDLKPGEQVEADLVVTDRAGKGVKSDVTFYAVDEGVLMLTGYKTPDPIPAFTAPRPLAVLTADSRSDMAKIVRLAGMGEEDKGGDGGGGGGGAAREDFRTTAYFNPKVATGADGKAHVSFKLPDSLTTYRLMAVVASETDRFGFGESQVVTSRPLMARPALPRFLRAGDVMDAGVVLTSKGLPEGDVEVTIAAQGASVEGADRRVVRVPAGGSVEARWKVAFAAAGSSKLTFRARGMGQSDDVAVAREVKAPLSLEAVALYGETAEAVAEKLADLKQIRGDVGGLDVRLASTALVGLDDGVQALVEYPYGCTEQLSSRLIPLVALSGIAKDYQIKVLENPRPIVDKAIAKILLNQRDDGGFGYWPDSRTTYPWLTAYATWALSQAKGAGYFVPEEVLTSAHAYLRRELPRLLSARSSEWERASAVLIVDVLATIGRPDAGYTAKLWAERDKLPLFARAQLGHAIALISKSSTVKAGETELSKKDVRELLRDLESHVRVTPTGAVVVDNHGDKYAELLDSDARTTAMVIRTLSAADPENPLLGRLVRGLLAARKGGAWRSTQENAWALVALDDYRRTNEAKSPDFDVDVFLGESKVMGAGFHERTVKAQSSHFSAQKLLDTGAGGSNLAFQVRGSGKLFYAARLRYSRKEMPTQPLDRGFTVRKVVRSLKPEGLRDALRSIPKDSAAAADAGDLVLVDLVVVTSDPREQVVIDDPLPAGLEAVDAKLATSARSLDVVDAGGDGDEEDERAATPDAKAMGTAFGSAWYHREIHDDRVLTFVEHMPAGMYHYRYLARATTPGKFVVPPTRAECMYEPETFGRTQAATFQVKPK